MSILSEDINWKTNMSEFLAYPVPSTQKDVFKFLAMRFDDLIQESGFMEKHGIQFRRMVAQRYLYIYLIILHFILSLLFLYFLGQVLLP